MAAHPLLMDLNTPAAEQSKKDRYKPMAPKFSTVKVRDFLFLSRAISLASLTLVSLPHRLTPDSRFDPRLLQDPQHLPMQVPTRSKRLPSSTLDFLTPELEFQEKFTWEEDTPETDLLSSNLELMSNKEKHYERKLGWKISNEGLLKVV